MINELNDLSNKINDDLGLKQQSQQLLLEANIETLREGRELLDLLDQGLFQRPCRPAFQSTIGEHFRHILEHFVCFFEQLECNTICYDQRQRDRRLEQDFEFALETIAKLENELQNFDPSYFEKSYLICDQQTSGPIITSLERELLFLQSHTTHHYAIIAAIARAHGTQPQADFGVAIATRVFQNEQRESGICAP